MTRTARTFAVALAATAFAAQADAQTPDRHRLSRWMDMAGCWEIKGSELSSGVDSFQQTGIGHIWVQDSNRVRLDRRLSIREATGALASLEANRQFAEVYYEITPGRIVAEEADAADPATTRRTVLLSPSGDAIFSTFLSNRTLYGTGAVNTTMWRLVSPDRIESETRSRDPHGSFWSDYAQVWTRLPSADPRCRTAHPKRG
jgi:hypothetical protein